MVAQCVPPPFAEQLSIAAFGHQVSALERCRLQARFALLDALPEEEIGKSPISLPSTWIATAHRGGMISYAALRRELADDLIAVGEPVLAPRANVKDAGPADRVQARATATSALHPQSPPWWRGVATDSPAGWPKSGQPGAHASVSRRIRTTTEYHCV